MSAPFFYIDSIPAANSSIELDEDTSRHISQVLRMKEGEKVKLTDGKGNVAAAIITSSHKKHSGVSISSVDSTPLDASCLTIAISLVKNAARFEWFLEKATEFGINEVIPLLCDRTERLKVRMDRLEGICRSAMLQSMQSWLPRLREPQSFEDVVLGSKHQQKMIAHCAVDAKVDYSSLFNPSLESHIILIGPEGDFSESEIARAKQCNFIPVSLGSTRLRTETAGLFAAGWACGVRGGD
jgi:16S rRNA (uracil1498-N3)-methyltransferase